MLRALLTVLALAGPAAAQDDGLTAAADRMAAAAAMLDAAQGPGARIEAFTEVVSAHDAALAALRGGLRAVALRRRARDAALARREEEIARLLGVLAAMGGARGPTSILHPQGALGGVRAGMLLADAAPALQGEADTLRAELAGIERLARLEREAQDALTADLEAFASARLALSEALSNRTDPPAPPPGATAPALRDRAARLRAFAGTLGALPDLPGAAPLSLPLASPVEGAVLRRPGEADAAGITRPGAILAPEPGAVLTAPASGTVLHAGPLLDYDVVIVLEPAPDVMLVFAGASTLYVEAGEVVPSGAPLAAMRDFPPSAPRDGDAAAGASSPETLYIEVREAEGPADPFDWFALE